MLPLASLFVVSHCGHNTHGRKKYINIGTYSKQLTFFLSLTTNGVLSVDDTPVDGKHEGKGTKNTQEYFSYKCVITVERQGGDTRVVMGHTNIKSADNSSVICRRKRKKNHLFGETEARPPMSARPVCSIITCRGSLVLTRITQLSLCPFDI